MKNKQENIVAIIIIGVIVVITIGAVGWVAIKRLQSPQMQEPVLFDDMGRQLTENFLRENKIKATYKMVAGGNNYYKYFKEEKEVTKVNGFAEDLLPAKLKNFIIENCPEKIYTPNDDGVTGTFSKYIYQLGEKGAYNFKFIEILVDEPTDNPASGIVCSWIRDEKTGEFSPVGQGELIRPTSQRQNSFVESRAVQESSLTSSNSDYTENNSEILKQKILEQYEKSNVKKINYLANYELITPEYDMNSNGPVEVDIKYEGNTVGSFDGYNGGNYIPIYKMNNDLFIISYCGGIGGMCRGDFIKYNIITHEKTTIKTDTLDFFLSNDGKKLIIFTVDDNWITFNMWIFNLETEKLVDQAIKLKCSNLSNVGKNCMDLFLENDQEIIYVPLGYDDIKVGDAYKLIFDNSKVAKFTLQLDVLSRYNLIFPVKIWE